MAILLTLWHIPDALWINLQPMLGPDKPPGTVRRKYVSGGVVFNSDLYVLGDALFREEAQSCWASANLASFGAKPAGLPIMFVYPWEQGLRRPPTTGPRNQDASIRIARTMPAMPSTQTK